MMTALDDPFEVEVREPHEDIDAVMFRLDVALAADADRYSRYTLDGCWLWGRGELLVDPDGTVRYA